MYMITMRLVGTPAAPDDLRELLTARFHSADRIEHLWTRADGERIDLVLFVLAECEAEALLTARAACLRAIAHTPRLAAWRLPDTTDADDGREFW
ncbi:hypothetical protein [Streptomyces stelliscabiei]|nr:hypothetical protein [Streptomyces stelliscabiei]KND38774.1 hypothetical protein IQ64_38280 [Streptomyces stelliscabiei]MDX2557169.1 hypothetical protein [Streptomyces stelliscabiei]MDX2616440.1 hypothetical protein [Streptomyces stelliscabiei]MDX2641142.1 hypothetical protein [Streptomyces stelliscabiei]MDX3442568.1 hypothetical protein [Streptomyces stelliscabiei]